MATKTEERFKSLLEEYFDNKYENQKKQINDSMYGIFIWGTVFGIILSYVNLIPLIFGIILGYITSKKKWIFIENWIEQVKSWSLLSQFYIKQMMKQSNDDSLKTS